MTPSRAETIAETVVIGGAAMPLSDFLSLCIDQSPAVTDDIRDACARFIAAGQRALATDGCAVGWLQRNITVPGHAPSPQLYQSVADLIRQARERELADLAFFMHKPPGIRLRLRSPSPDDGALAQLLDAALGRWLRSGLIDGWLPAVYEPETYLFGGALSMQHVHELFSVDALAWLDIHALDTRAAAPSWAVSLLMLRAFLTALSIADWEDVDIWERVRRTGRMLPPDILNLPDSAELFAEIRAAWSQPESLYADLSESQRAVIERYDSAIRLIALRWQQDYFESHGARIGPRAAAALFVIFHWNRAALPMTRQALITEALLTRETI